MTKNKKINKIKVRDPNFLKAVNRKAGAHTDIKKEKNKNLCREEINYENEIKGDVRLIVCFDLYNTTLKEAYTDLMNYLKKCPYDLETSNECYFNEDLIDGDKLNEVAENYWFNKGG